MAVQVFGGGAVQTAYVSFLALDITSNSLTLVWPSSYVNVPYNQDGIFYNVLAASMTVTTTMGNMNTITLPDATLSSVGSNFVITNIGAAAFDLKTSDGNTLINIPSTASANSYWVQLTGNSTSKGTWQFIQFGTGTSSADASALAGLGLTAISTTLNTTIPVQEKSSSYSVMVSDRASLIVWTGGADTIMLPLIVNAPTGFYVSFNNEGTGELTIQGNANIDGSTTISVLPHQSLSIISNGTQWYTLGFGQNLVTNAFESGSATAPAITFIADSTTGFYYTTTPLLGASVSGASILNIISAGLQMSPGKTLNLPDGANNAHTILSTNGTYSQIQHTRSSAISNIQLSGTTAETTLRLVQGSDLILTSTDTAGTMAYGTTTALSIDNIGQVTLPAKPLPIASGGTGQITQQAAINALIPGGVPNNLVYYGGSGWAPLTTPLPLASGGTGANTQQTALNALMPGGATNGDLIYFNGTNWIRLAPGSNGQTLKIVGGVPAWSA